jgi:Ca-activated chloride channel family protein
VSGQISLKCTVNREFLPPDKRSIVYLAMDIVPPRDMDVAGALSSAICLLIDRSGSMKGKKIEQVREAASQLVDGFLPTDYIGMVTFSDGVEVISSFERVQSVDTFLLKGKIERLKAYGNTELYKGLETAYEQILQTGKTAGNVVKRIILLSDGQPTDKVPETEYVRLASRMREMGISILTLGVGKDYNEDLLAALATQSGGEWKHISSPSEISDVFSTQLAETRTVLHVLPDVIMHLSQDVELQEVFKAIPDVYTITNLKQNGLDFAIPLSDIKAGEPQTLAIKLSVPPGQEGTFKLATVEVEDLPGTQCDIIINYSKDERLLAIENNAFPRGIFATAKTQVLTRAGISDDTALKQAEDLTETILKDPNLSGITTIRAAAEKIGDTIDKAKAGLSEEETKEAKEDMTQTQIWRPEDK